MIIDAHCHMPPRDDGVTTAMERMRVAGVDHTLLVPGGMIPSLGLADFLRGTAPLEEREPCNAFIIDLVKRTPTTFSAMYHFNPDFDEIEDAGEALAAGFCGFKLNPLVDRLSYDEAAIDELFAFACQRGVPLYTHIVLAGGASLEPLLKVLNRHPGLILILGHMGFASSDGAAIAAARRFPNMLLETSVGAFHAISEAYRKLGASKIVFGSEGPAHHPAVELRKLELLGAPDGDMEMMMGGNIRPFLSIQ